MQLYGLRNCDTCRAARKALPEADFVDVRESPLDRSILETALERFGDALLNRKSTTWRGLSAGDRARPPLGRHACQVDPDQFSRSATDIDHQKLLRPRTDKRRTGHDGKLRLLLRFDDLQPQPGFAVNAVHEIAPVRGPAAGLGRDQAHFHHLVAFQLLLTDAQGLDRAIDRGTRKPPGLLESRAQLNGFGKAVDN